jgi:carboxyl-terminal processing protease
MKIIISIILLMITSNGYGIIKDADSELNDYLNIFKDTYNILQKEFIRPLTPNELFSGVMKGLREAPGSNGPYEWIDPATNAMDDYFTDYQLFEKFLSYKMSNRTQIGVNDLVLSAIVGMVSGLNDPYSQFILPPKQTNNIKTSDGLTGIGIHLGMRNGNPMVIDSIPGSPASRVGIMSGDILLEVDNQPVGNETINDIVLLLRGDPGSTEILKIQREGKVLSIPVVREFIHFVPFQFGTITNSEKRIAYLKILEFPKNLLYDLTKALEGFDWNGIDGIVLDLRHCPGGLLNQVSGTLDLFIDSGLLFKTVGRTKEYTTDFLASGDKSLIPSNIPVSVLIGRSTTSGAELLAAVLRERKRAVLVGESTLGYGSIQKTFAFNNSLLLKYTISKFILPSGLDLNKVGVKPDFLITNSLSADDSSKVQELLSSGVILPYLSQADLSDKGGLADRLIREKGLKIKPELVELAIDCVVANPLIRSTHDAQLRKAMEILIAKSK